MSDMKASQRADVLRICVLGDKQVGKTAFMKCITFGLYDPYMQSSLKMDFITREIIIGQEKVVFQLWEKELQSYHSLIIMYDITSRQSFANAVKIVEEVCSDKDMIVPILLLGNKIDIQQKRQVMAYEGEMTALHYQILFNEVSCIEAVNTRQSVTELIETIM